MIGNVSIKKKLGRVSPRGAVPLGVVVVAILQKWAPWPKKYVGHMWSQQHGVTAGCQQLR